MGSYLTAITLSGCDISTYAPITHLALGSFPVAFKFLFEPTPARVEFIIGGSSSQRKMSLASGLALAQNSDCFFAGGRNNMVSYAAAFVLSLVSAALLTPVVRTLSYRFNLLDVPNERKVHRAAVPRTGGIAVAVAFLVPVFGIAVTNAQVGKAVYANWALVFGITTGAIFMAFVGLLDDLKGLGALTKLLLQAGAATLAYLCGFRIQGMSLPFGGVLDMGVFAYPATVIWIVGIINALNLIDGLDGLAAGIGFFVLLFNFVLGFVNESIFVCLIAASLAGAILGFLFYNFNPASIFMGDCGSMLVGYVLALGAINSGQKSSTTVALLTPIAAMGIPIMDTLFSMVRRFLERRSLFSPDKGHIHHKLLSLGLDQRKVVLILYMGTVALILAASLLHFGKNWQVGIGLLVMVAFFFVFARLVGVMDYITRRRYSRLGIWTHHTEMLRRSLPEALERCRKLSGRESVEEFLGWFLKRNDLKFVDIFLQDDENPVLKATNPDYAGSSREPLLIAEVQLCGKERELAGRMRFGWHSERGRVSSATEILLQLVGDALGAERIRTVLGPKKQAVDLPQR